MAKAKKAEKPKTGTGQVVTKAAFAKIMGTTARTIGNWERRGMPSVRVGSGRGGNKIYTADAILWWANDREQKRHPGGSDGPANINDERLRLTTEQADEKAIKNAVDRSELIASEYISEFAMTTVANLVGALSGMPGRMATAVAREDSPAKCRELLKIEIDRARVQFADSFSQLAEFNESRADTVIDIAAAAK